ncbi:hypothetical protein MMC07_001856 [Pseudocyphellaria aurata]|nr:hypothetical protein [Pseudocyphellaria aurata]
MEHVHEPKMLQDSNLELLTLVPPPPVARPSSILKRQNTERQQCTSSPTSPETLQIPEGHPEQSPLNRLSKLKSVTIIATLAGISFLNTMGSGVLISALPRIADDIGLEEGLLLWPASVYALAAGCLLLIFGAVADVIGAKLIWVTGSFLYVVFTVAVGLSRTGVQMILFRTFLGAAVAMCLPTAVSLITNTFPKGTWRNVAFASNGLGQPLGYSVGLILGGVFTDTIGWRWSFFVSAIINFAISMSAVWVLPSVYRPSNKSWNRRLVDDIDWVGACVLSISLGILLYVLATATSSYRRLSDVQNIVLLVFSIVLLAVFPLYMSYQVRHQKPAIIPNKLWRSAAFTTTCIAVFLCWGSLNSFHFQRVQSLSALQSSIRFLPHVITGVSINVLTGYLISRVKVRVLVVTSAVVTMVASPLMATVEVHESYWRVAFWAMLLSPVNPDVLFTVSNLIISNAYPPDVQSLAGGVFNVVAQFGNSVGLAVTAAIAASVTEHSKSDHVDALMEGYHAAFWTIFAATSIVAVISFFGLKKGGLVGKKDE